MKIASIYSFTAFPPKGGNHLHAWQMIRHFQAAGHEVLTWGDDSPPGVQAFARTEEGGAALAREADALYVRIDGNRLGADPLLVRLLETAESPIFWEINAPANENLAFSWIGGDRPKPRSAVSRAIDQLRRRRHARQQYPAIEAEDRLRTQLAIRVAGATCVSAALVQYAREQLKIGEVIETPNGGDPEFNRPDGPVADLPERFRGSLKVLYAGSPIYPWQGLDIVTGAMELCARAGDPVSFILLMNQPPVLAVPGSNSLLVTHLPYEKVQEYVRAADVGLAIHPDYFWSPWGFHGSSMKMFDYMACGRPVVASNIGQLAEIIKPWQNGVLTENSPEALRRVLLELVQRKNEIPAMGAAARRDIEEKYNWERVAQKTLELIEKKVRL